MQVQTPIPIPDWLEAHKCLRTLCCCYRPEWFNYYEESLKTVTADQKQNLDIVTLMRRLRSHGFALSILLDETILKLVSTRSHQKALEEVDKN